MSGGPDGATIPLPARHRPGARAARPRLRPPALAGFASKLAILLDALNWTRAELARRAGVDKSVALRWAAGSVVPGEASLVALTAAIRGEVPGFARADWCLPDADFAARLRPAPATPLPAAAAFAFPRLACGTAAAPSRYGGCWLLLRASALPPGRPAVEGCLAAVAPRDGMAWMRAEGGPRLAWRAEGPVVPLHGLIHAALEKAGRGMTFCVLWGSATGKAMVLDGIVATADAARRAPPAAARMIGLRLDDRPDPAWYDAALRRLSRLDGEDLAARLPAALAARFAQAAPPGPMAMTVPAETALACDAEAIEAGLAPSAAAAIAAARALLDLP